jgi:2-polyprenyl-3-methyl-5-hydroxy-6-metoxy-1,4-benzoquinol methylase
VNTDAETGPLGRHLACPRCRASLRISNSEAGCPACGRVGVLKQAVWDFVGEEDYAKSFGQQWTRFNHTQLDSRNGTIISQSQFELVTGWPAAELKHQSLLDAGCGAGRYSEVAVRAGACVVAMDLSEAAFVARANLANTDASLVVRGDLLHPPLALGSFDRVVSIGVLQHTPDPLGAIRRLMQVVRPGGQLVIWMYERRWYSELLPKSLLRRITRHLSPSVVSRLSGFLVRSFTPAARRIGRISRPKLRRALAAMLPLATYWGTLPLNDSQQVEWSLLDTNDWLSPAFDLPQRYTDVKRVLLEEGASEVFRRPVPGLTVSATRRSDP